MISEAYKSQAPKPFGSLTARLTVWVGEPHSLLAGASKLDINPSTFWLQLLLLVAVAPSRQNGKERFLGNWLGLPGKWQQFQEFPISSFPGKLGRIILRRWVPPFTSLLPEKRFPVQLLHSPLDEQCNLTLPQPTTLRRGLLLAPLQGTLSRGLPFFD